MSRLHNLGLRPSQIATLEMLQDGDPNKRLTEAIVLRQGGVGRAAVAKLRLAGLIDDGAFPTLHEMPIRVHAQLSACFPNEAALRAELERRPGLVHVKGISPPMWRRIVKKLGMESAPVTPLTREELLNFIRDAVVELDRAGLVRQVALATKGRALLTRANTRHKSNRG